MDISIVISLLNEKESLPELISQIEKALEPRKFSYEVIMVNDGSTDGSWETIKELAKTRPYIKGISFRRNYGKSAALYCGFEAAQGDVVITMDADLQDNPNEIPELYDMIVKEGYDLVSGWKKKRYDPVFTKNLPSKLFNATARKVSGVKLHDFNCGLKAYRKEVVKNIEVYGEMHRYIPVIAKAAGFKHIGEKVVQHQKRKYGTTKFGMSRFIRGYLDLLTITFISKFGKRPMHLFGGLGTLLFLAGFIMGIYLVFQKLFNSVYGMTDRPLFYLALICMIIGTQFFLTGFIAELIQTNSSNKKQYGISERINN